MIAQNAGGSTSYYVYNAHGDTTSLLNSSGSVVRTYDNDSFGKSITNFGTGATTPFRYNGQYTDIDTGLIYLRNRCYDPTTGRFTQEDPAKDGLNWYVYCANDPVNFVDPLGLLSIGTFCKNDVSQLTEQQRKNMNSAINAYEDGFLSYGNMLENLASNGGEINEMKKLSPVEAQMVGNNLNIVVYANASNVEGDAEFASNVSYKSIVIKGIEAFSGQIEGININVKVRYGESNSHKTINVEFYHGNKRSYAYGYTSVVYSAAKDPEEGDAVRNIIYTTAHEAGGHCAFRLQDAYRDAFSNRPNLKNVDSIMNNHYGGVTDLDRAMLVRAYKLGDFTKEIYFQDNTDLLDKYSKRWGWQ